MWTTCVSPVPRATVTSRPGFAAQTPATGAEVPLFHPRRQVWRDHFTWSQDGAQVIGLTPCGRATIEALHLNHPLIVVARSIWVRAGLHPPTSGL